MYEQHSTPPLIFMSTMVILLLIKGNMNGYITVDNARHRQICCKAILLSLMVIIVFLLIAKDGIIIFIISNIIIDNARHRQYLIQLRVTESPRSQGVP